MATLKVEYKILELCWNSPYDFAQRKTPSWPYKEPGQGPKHRHGRLPVTAPAIAVTKCRRGAVPSDAFYEEETGFSEPREGGRRVMCVRTHVGQKNDGFNTDLERSPTNQGKSAGRPSLEDVPRRNGGRGSRRVPDRRRAGPPIRTLEGAEGRGRGGQGRGHRLPHREPGFLRRPWAVALGKAEPSPAPHRMPVETEFVYPHSGAGSEGSMTCSDLRCLFNRRAQPWEEHKTQHHPE